MVASFLGIITMNNFDLISDIHLDFWVRQAKNYENGPQDLEEIIVQFIARILPKQPSSVLIIAGDIGHSNHETSLFLKNLSQFYKQILFVFGNHDFYLLPFNREHQKFEKSRDRWEELVEMACRISGVVPLDGNTVTVEGVTFGGTGMWYDYSYGLRLGYSWDKLDRLWKSSFNDSNYIIGGTPDFELEREKLQSIIHQCDVVVTHIGPDASRIQPIYEQDPTSAFYYFDGQDLLADLKGKIWCYGHVHQRLRYVKDGCLLVNHALGYPGELPFTKIRTVPLQYSNDEFSQN